MAFPPAGTASTSVDTFSVVWTGQIEPEFSEPYVYYLIADDSATLWLNDQAGNPVVIGQMKLDAGKKVNLRLEYVE